MASEPARPFFVQRRLQQRKRGEAPKDAWAVRQGERWRFTEDLCVQVPMTSQEHPEHGAVLTGIGVVRCLKRGELVVTA